MCKQSGKIFKKKKKKGDHVPSGYLLCTKWAFDPIENKHILYRGEDRMKKFCSSLRKHTANVVNFKKKKMLPLKTHQDATACYFCGKSFPKKFAKDEDYRRVRDHCHFTGKYRYSAYSI